MEIFLELEDELKNAGESRAYLNTANNEKSSGNGVPPLNLKSKLRSIGDSSASRKLNRDMIGAARILAKKGTLKKHPRMINQFSSKESKQSQAQK